MDLSKAIIRLVKKTPILGSILYQVNLSPSDDPAIVAGIDMQSNPDKPILHYNFNWSKNFKVEFKDELEESEANAVILLHEILHLFLLHPLRRDECKKIFQKYNREYDHTLVNIAADYAVNGFLVSHFWKNDMPKVFNFIAVNELSAGKNSPGKINILYDEKLKNESMESILESLIKQDMKSGGSGGQIDDHEKMFTNNSNKLAEKVKQICNEIANEMRKAGDLPGDIDDYITIKINKKNWKIPLLMSLSEAILKSKLRYPNKRVLYNEYVLPRMTWIKKPDIDIVASIDVSGSISNDELSYFAGELLKLSNNYGIKRVLLHDSKIQQDIGAKELENMLKSGKIKITGRGGTDFRPVFELLEKDNPACLVMFTDCEGPFPVHPPKFPVIILNINKEKAKLPAWAKEIKYEI